MIQREQWTQATISQKKVALQSFFVGCEKKIGSTARLDLWKNKITQTQDEQLLDSYFVRISEAYKQGLQNFTTDSRDSYTTLCQNHAKEETKEALLLEQLLDQITV